MDKQVPYPTIAVVTFLVVKFGVKAHCDLCQANFRLEFFVIPIGFEPMTHSLEGCCSIQLSYGTNYKELN